MMFSLKLYLALWQVGPLYEQIKGQTLEIWPGKVSLWPPGERESEEGNQEGKALHIASVNLMASDYNLLVSQMIANAPLQSNCQALLTTRQLHSTGNQDDMTSGEDMTAGTCIFQ